MLKSKGACTIWTLLGFDKHCTTARVRVCYFMSWMFARVIKSLDLVRTHTRTLNITHVLNRFKRTGTVFTVAFTDDWWKHLLPNFVFTGDIYTVYVSSTTIIMIMMWYNIIIITLTRYRAVATAPCKRVRQSAEECVYYTTAAVYTLYSSSIYTPMSRVIRVIILYYHIIRNLVADDCTAPPRVTNGGDKHDVVNWKAAVQLLCGVFRSRGRVITICNILITQNIDMLLRYVIIIS